MDIDNYCFTCYHWMQRSNPAAYADVAKHRSANGQSNTVSKHERPTTTDAKSDKPNAV